MGEGSGEAFEGGEGREGLERRGGGGSGFVRREVRIHWNILIDTCI